MRIGVFRPPGLPVSFKVYADNVCRHLAGNGFDFIPFEDASAISKDWDLIWDIRSGGGNPPPESLLTPGLPPLVVTIHGFAPMSLPSWEYFRSIKEMLLSVWGNMKKRSQWKLARDKIKSVIAVSEFTKQEVIRIAGIESARITVCLHGVDDGLFSQTRQPQEAASPPYFLHVSNDEPRKNVPRIVRAFQKIRKHYPVELTLKLPKEATHRYQGIDGVNVISGYLQDEELASLYRGALAFLFPSLYEGFGLPILEAMASGCPVITSNVSACPEVAGDAAVIINPRSEKELFDAMVPFCKSPEERLRHATAVLRRSRELSWVGSAECHQKAFVQALSKV